LIRFGCDDTSDINVELRDFAFCVAPAIFDHSLPTITRRAGMTINHLLVKKSTLCIELFLVVNSLQTSRTSCLFISRSLLSSFILLWGFRSSSDVVDSAPGSLPV